jgi:HPt (histidine-containing phosphotransfer) domain-containing protein
MESITSSTAPVWDIRGALGRLGGDETLLEELIVFCLQDAPGLATELQAAVDDGNAPLVRMKAHALKGLVAGCGGVRAAEAAQQVETAGQGGDLGNIDPLLQKLGDELQAFSDALTAYRDK